LYEISKQLKALPITSSFLPFAGIFGGDFVSVEDLVETQPIFI
jgi:hypothetical protein